MLDAPGVEWFLQLLRGERELTKQDHTPAVSTYRIPMRAHVFNFTGAPYILKRKHSMTNATQYFALCATESWKL